MEDKITFAWLVENGNNYPSYRTVVDGCITWVKDPWEALWFCRRQDAERFAAEDEDAWCIVEHIFHLEEKLNYDSQSN